MKDVILTWDESSRLILLLQAMEHQGVPPNRTPQELAQWHAKHARECVDIIDRATERSPATVK